MLPATVNIWQSDAFAAVGERGAIVVLCVLAIYAFLAFLASDGNKKKIRNKR